jgi:hypothetical protein
MGGRDEPEKFCPILSASLLGTWPMEWTRRTVEWQYGDASGSYEAVDECTEFDRRPDGGGGDDDPEPEPGPPPVIEGQIDMFEVFTEQFVESLPDRLPART